MSIEVQAPNVLRQPPLQAALTAPSRRLFDRENGEPSFWLPLFLDFLGRIKIVSKELTEPAPMEPYGAQIQFLDEICTGLDVGVHHFVCLKARQLGISTIMLALDLFWLWMFPGLQGALIADSGENRDTFKQTIEIMLEGLPEGFKIPVKRHNRNGLLLKNGSRLMYMAAGKRKNSGLGRSRGLNFVHATECSSWGDQKGLDSLIAALAAENPHRLYIFESTALGYNLFFEMCETAKAKSLEQRFFFIGWWAKEIYRFPVGSAKFVEYWEKKPFLTKEENDTQIAVFERYGHQITAEQWAWYRAQAADKSDASLKEEFPSCVAADTRVGTDKGILRIDEIAVGMEGTLGPVRAQGPTGVAPMYRLTTEMGYTIRGTADHPMALAGGGFVDLSQADGADIALCKPRFAKDVYVHRWRDGVTDHAIEITPDLALFIGMFMGDGSQQGAPHYGHSLCCTADDQDVVDEALRLYHSLFGLTPHIRHVGPNKGGTEIRVGSRMLCETLRSLGLLRNDTTKTMRNVHVPEVIWRSPEHVVRQFLRGLFETDGFVNRDGHSVIFFSKFPEFARDVQHLLLGFGVTCRRSTSIKRATSKGKSHSYNQNKLVLRTSESLLFNERIGFVSARKMARARVRPTNVIGHNRRGIELQDRVVSVVADGEDQSWNLSIGTHKLFDAGGLLTHNTEGEAFQSTGSSFFETQRTASDIAFLNSNAVVPKHYSVHLGENFTRMKVADVPAGSDVADLLIWEPPNPRGRYVMGVDPATGEAEGPDPDRTAISIWRGYADKLVQVAEYATTNPTSQQCCWVMAYLAACYRDCIINLEKNGPGLAVMGEMRSLRQAIQFGELRDFTLQIGRTGALEGIRWFLYHRAESMGGDFIYNFTTNPKTKVELLNSMRDAYNTQKLVVRSVPLLREMSTLSQDGTKIKGSGRNKDDRVFGGALAQRAWSEWLRPTMMADKRTWASEHAAEEADRKVRTGVNGEEVKVVDGIVKNFFAQQAKARQTTALTNLFNVNY